MSRANDDTQVDYSLLDGRALGDAVAEKVLGWQTGQAIWLRRQEPPTTWRGDVTGEELISWWGAGLVIDTLRAEGRAMLFDIEPSPALSHVHTSTSVGRDESPIRAILIAALRAKEAE